MEHIILFGDETMDDNYRFPKAIELALLQKLLERDFPGRERLSKQLDGLLVKTTDKEGSLSLKVVPHAIPADVRNRIVSEGYYSDEDASSTEGVQVHVLLHVENGFLLELEIYKDDGLPIRKRPVAQELILE